jgi:hypothetical protein
MKRESIDVPRSRHSCDGRQRGSDNLGILMA